MLLLSVGCSAACARSPDGSTDAASTTSSSEGSTGLCESEFHGPYYCECHDGTKMCDTDGVSLCVSRDDDVITDYKWSPCGECLPGEQRACDRAGVPGRQFCNVLQSPTTRSTTCPPSMGTCLREEEIACEPGQSKQCGDNASVDCDVDETGVPYWPSC
ncbi:hypothetical protein [Nannocystis pusilla]|uniref:hypothetical protein n=1 Tax=Nannocystis pusilla TaxID=889268 RepID=UPI003B7C506C